MVRAEELRCGNKVLISTEISDVTCISVDGISASSKTAHYAFEPFEFVQPIPLTPEILVKCGFEDWSGDTQYGKFGLVMNDINIIFAYKIKEKIFERVDVDEFSIYHINYIHQLQNLYFALTGEELIINL